MGQQRAFACRTHPRHLVQWRGGGGLGTLCAVRADGPAVRLVAQSLHEVEHGVIHTQGKGHLAGAVELFLAMIAVDALGNADEGNVVHAKLCHDLGHSRDLPRATVDQQKVGPGL